MKRFISFFAWTVVVLTTLSIFGWTVREIHRDKGPSGILGSSIRALVAVPDLFQRAATEVQRLPQTFVPTHPDFSPVNTLDTDLPVLLTYTNEKNNRTVEIRNLRNDSVWQQWEVRGLFPPHHRIVHPFALEDGALVYATNGYDGIHCMDASGEERWHQKQVGMHHAMNVGPDGNLWLCAYDLRVEERALNSVRYQMGAKEYKFLDNHIAALSPATGEVVYVKSVAELIRENGLEYLIVKSPVVDDPLHLNDVQPVLTSGPHMQAGDLFLSFRTPSVVLHFRPSTGEVLRVIEGPFHSQHDVDILSDSTIAIFNNNAPTKRWTEDPKRTAQDTLLDFGTYSSHIVHLNLATGKFTAPDKEAFAQAGIYTFTEGLFEYLPDGSVFVEEQNPSLLWVLKDGVVRYKGVVQSHHDGHHHLANWARPLQK